MARGPPGCEETKEVGEGRSKGGVVGGFFSRRFEFVVAGVGIGG